MTDAPSGPPERAQGRGYLWWTVAATGVLVVVLLAYLIVIIPTGLRVIPGTSTGDQRESDVKALRSAASQELSAFYSLDYHSIDSILATISGGATGSFGSKFTSLSISLKEGVGQLKVQSKGTVQQMAVNQIKGDSATLLAVVNQTLSNSQTRGKTAATTGCAAGSVCNYFHLWVTYQRVGGQWKMANLEYLR